MVFRPASAIDENLVMLLGDKAFDQNVARPCGGLPVDIADVITRHVRPQVVELEAAGVHQRVPATVQQPGRVAAEELLGAVEMGAHDLTAPAPQPAQRRPRHRV